MRTIQEKLDTNQERMESKMDAYQEKMEDWQEEMKSQVASLARNSSFYPRHILIHLVDLFGLFQI
jgi:sulfur relay (sulfurtransferase) DsrC/TusE family protein